MGEPLSITRSFKEEKTNIGGPLQKTPKVESTYSGEYCYVSPSRDLGLVFCKGLSPADNPTACLSWIFDVKELGEEIATYLDDEALQQLSLTSKMIRKHMKNSKNIQAKQYGVPTQKEALETAITFRNETIGHLMKSEFKAELLDEASTIRGRCIHGFEGHNFIVRDWRWQICSDEGDTPYLANSHCCKPCVLDGARMEEWSLSPQALRRVVFRILFEAKQLDESRSSQSPLVPRNFRVSCDARFISRID